MSIISDILGGSGSAGAAPAAPPQAPNTLGPESPSMVSTIEGDQAPKAPVTPAVTPPTSSGILSSVLGPVESFLKGPSTPNPAVSARQNALDSVPFTDSAKSLINNESSISINPDLGVTKPVSARTQKSTIPALVRAPSNLTNIQIGPDSHPSDVSHELFNTIFQRSAISPEDFNAAWDKAKATNPDMQPIDDHLDSPLYKEAYQNNTGDNVKTDPYSLATERFAYMGSLWGNDGLSSLPASLQPFYASYLKDQAPTQTPGAPVPDFNGFTDGEGNPIPISQYTPSQRAAMDADNAARQKQSADANSPIGEIGATIGNIPEATVDTGINIARAVPRALGTIAYTADKGISDVTGLPQPGNTAKGGIMSSIFGDAPLQTVGERGVAIQKMIGQNPKSTSSRFEAPFIGSIGTLADLLPLDGGELAPIAKGVVPEEFINYLADEKDPVKIAQTLKQVGVGDANAQTLGHLLAPTSTSADVLDVLQNYSMLPKTAGEAVPVAPDTGPIKMEEGPDGVYRPVSNEANTVPKSSETQNSSSAPEIPDNSKSPKLENLNPTGSVFTDYNPSARATMPLGKNITTLDKTSGKSPDEQVIIYRGAPKNQTEINPGDFITTNSQIAKDYAGDGNVIQKTVRMGDVLDDSSEPLGEEYIYRPNPTSKDSSQVPEPAIDAKKQAQIDLLHRQLQRTADSLRSALANPVGHAKAYPDSPPAVYRQRIAALNTKLDGLTSTSSQKGTQVSSVPSTVSRPPAPTVPASKQSSKILPKATRETENQNPLSEPAISNTTPENQGPQPQPQPQPKQKIVSSADTNSNAKLPPTTKSIDQVLGIDKDNGVDNNKPWSQMTPAEKRAAYDANQKIMNDRFAREGTQRSATEKEAIKPPGKRSISSLNPLKDMDPETQAIFRKFTATLNEAKIVGLKYNGKFPEADKMGSKAYDAYQLSGTAPHQKEIEGILRDIYQHAKGNGFSNLPHRANYLPQIYNEVQQLKPDTTQEMIEKLIEQGATPEEAKAYVQGAQDNPDESMHLKQNPFFEKGKMHPTYAEAKATAGLTPKYTKMSELIGVYHRLELQTTATRTLEDDLLDKGKVAVETLAPRDWVPIQYGPLKGYFAAPKITNFFNNYFEGHENMRNLDTALKQTAEKSKFAQHMALSTGIPFTSIDPYSLGIANREVVRGNFKALGSWLKSNFNDATIKSLQKDYQYMEMMARNGIVFRNTAGNLPENYQTAAAKWADLKENVKAKPFSPKSYSPFASIVGKGLTDVFGRKAFENFIPLLHVQVFKDAYLAAIKKGVPEETAQKLAASLTQKSQGIMEDVGRSAKTQDAISAFMFAPQYREGIVNTLINSGKSILPFTIKKAEGGGYTFAEGNLKDPQYRYSRQLLAGLAIMYGVYSLLNHHYSGHGMEGNESGHQLDLRIPRKDGTILYIPLMPGFLALPRAFITGAESLAQGDTKGAFTSVSSAASMAVQTVTQVLTNSNYFGNPIYKATDTAGEKRAKIATYLGSQFTPSYVQAIANSAINKGSVPLYQSLIQATQLPIKFGTAAKEQTNDVFNSIDAQATARAQAALAAENEWTKLSTLAKTDKAGAAAQFDALNKSNPTLAAAVSKIATDAAKGITATDRATLLLGVKTGARAQYIYQEVMKMPADQRGPYVDGLIAKKIVTGAVSLQLSELIKNNGKFPAGAPAGQY